MSLNFSQPEHLPRKQNAACELISQEQLKNCLALRKVIQSMS